MSFRSLSTVKYRLSYVLWTDKTVPNIGIYFNVNKFKFQECRKKMEEPAEK